MSENLALWELVEKTPPDQTKAITGKPYKGNSPKPHWLVRKATETFGPCGIGWGFEIVDEKLLDGALLAENFHERIHMARVRVWYEWNGKRGTVEHVGQTVFCGKRNTGQPFTDEDAPKKSVTDGLVKALSMIGFAGDIFLGRYDDSKYVEETRREFAGTVNGHGALGTAPIYLRLETAMRDARSVDELKDIFVTRKADVEKLTEEQRLTLRDFYVTRARSFEHMAEAAQ
jgi:hypothetical protein